VNIVGSPKKNQSYAQRRIQDNPPRDVGTRMFTTQVSAIEVAGLWRAGKRKNSRPPYQIYIGQVGQRQSKHKRSRSLRVRKINSLVGEGDKRGARIAGKAKSVLISAKQRMSLDSCSEEGLSQGETESSVSWVRPG